MLVSLYDYISYLMNGLFHIPRCLQDSSMFSLCQDLSLFSNVHQILCTHLPTDKVFWLFLSFPIGKDAFMNMDLQISIQISTLNHFSLFPRHAIVESHANS